MQAFLLALLENDPNSDKVGNPVYRAFAFFKIYQLNKKLLISLCTN